MSGSVAGTIQGEAGSNPANQFAVASTIYNRLQAGGYGSSANAIVNAPNQYTGRSSTPNATAQQFAQAIEDGTLPQYGRVGNAVNFQTAGSDTPLGRNPQTVNIGGNNFSDRFGTPTSSFVPPEYGGTNVAVNQDNGIATENVGDFGFQDPTSGTPLNASMGVTSDTQVAANIGSDATADSGQGDILSDPNTGQSVGPMFGGADSAAGLAFHPTGGAVGKAANEAVVTGLTTAKTAYNLGTGGLDNAVNAGARAISGVKESIDAFGGDVITAARKTVADVFGFVPNVMVMLLAIVLLLVAAWLMVPRETKTRIATTAAKVAA